MEPAATPMREPTASFFKKSRRLAEGREESFGVLGFIGMVSRVVIFLGLLFFLSDREKREGFCAKWQKESCSSTIGVSR